MGINITRDLLGVNFGKLFEKVTTENVFDYVLGQLAEVVPLAESSTLDHDYYTGMIDAYENVARLLAPVENEDGLFRALGKFWNASPEASPSFLEAAENVDAMLMAATDAA